jgi:poly(A) polymerase
MQPTNIKIEQPWLDSDGVQSVMRALGAEGGVARFVGGCVRDALFHRPVRDIDIASDSPPEEVMDLLTSAGLRFAPTGLAHGTITAIADGHGFEVTTLRHDAETDGRRAKVAFTDDWLIDAQRRDFTMNALYCDADGTIYDPVGGLADIAAEKVRFIGAAEDRITEDYLRILRFFRFHAWYGTGDMDDGGLQACLRQQGGVEGLSIERIRAEFLRLLECPDPLPTVTTMAETGILATILPHAPDLSALQRVVTTERAADMADPLRRLASLFEPDMSQAIVLGRAWKLSNDDKKRIKSLVLKHVVDGFSQAEAKVAIYKSGRTSFVDNLLVWSSGFDERAASLLKLAQEWVPPTFPLNGQDVMARGVGEGQAIGQHLNGLEDQWIAEVFTPDRAELLARLDAMIARN